jgi:glycosyltransferase involved in cell wall biosynthesis
MGRTIHGVGSSKGDIVVKMTVVIPTRERCGTLVSTLRTCLDQEYDDLSIIVSDNAGEDETAAVVTSMADSRIRYVNPGRRVSMTANWEFALRHVEDGYVTVIGDDDGLLPQAVRDVAALIAQHKASVITWRKVQYCWPNHPDPLYRNLAIIPMNKALFHCNAKALARDIAALWTPYDIGPCLYNSFVSVAAIRRSTERQGGTFLHAIAPDCYSTFAIASEVDSTWYSFRPFSVNGASGKSNGANISGFLRDERDNATRQFVEEHDLPLHPKLPEMMIGSGVAITIDAALQANDRCFGGTLPIDLQRVVWHIVREVSPAPAERYNHTMERLERLAQQRPEVRSVLARSRQKYPNRPVPPFFPSYGVNERDELVIDMSSFGAEDVATVARFTGNLLGGYVAPSRFGTYSHSMKFITRGLDHVRSRFGYRVMPV